MRRRIERPVRRTTVFAAAILLLVACGVVAGFFLFLATAIHPAFLALAAWTVGGGIGIGCWAWRELHATDKAMSRIEETVLLDVEAIARHQPPAPRRRRDPRRWLRYFRHVRSSAKEGVQQ